MNLLDILSADCVVVPLQAQDKKGVIDELVDVLATAGKVKDPGTLKSAVWARECTRTTGIGYGLAIPHGKSEGVVNLAMAVGIPAQPLEFQSIDHKPVRLIVLLASALDKTTDHIQALAKISRLMMNEEFRNRVYSASTPAEVYELLQQQELAVAAGKAGG